MGDGVTERTLRRVIGGWELRVMDSETTATRFLPAPATEREALVWAGHRVPQTRAWRVRQALGWTPAELAECLGCSLEHAEELELGRAQLRGEEARILRLLWRDL